MPETAPMLSARGFVAAASHRDGQPGRAAELAWASAAADLAACRARLAHGSRTFLAASLLLPARVRAPACALYAFCRAADDEVDGQSGGQAAAAGATPSAEQAAAAVARLRGRLQRLYQGRPDDCAEDRALAAVVRRFAIPAALPEALLDGFAWDAEQRSYDTLAELQAYAARVAGTVGAMMALLMGVRSAAALSRACDLGVAMQLSNIARDVGEDARAGRLYLPRQWLAEAGIDAQAWLARPHDSPALGQVVRRLLQEADALYARVDAGVAALPLRCRPGINAARFLYAQIGHEVQRGGWRPVASRAVVPGRRKLWGLARALLSLMPDDSAAALPPLAATRPLVEAVTGPLTAQLLNTPPPGLARVVVLFDRLERRDRGLRWAER